MNKTHFEAMQITLFKIKITSSYKEVIKLPHKTKNK